MRSAFPKFIEKEFKRNKKIFTILGDIGVHSFRNVFKKYNKNILNIGILEQSMVGFSAGLAIENKIPFIHTIAPFLINRCYEQIKIDLCYQNLNVNIVSVGASIDYAALGSTHHCPEDVSLLNQLPNISIYVPGNEDEILKLFQLYKNKGPKYFRMSSQNHNTKIQIFNGAGVIKKGSKGLIIVIGPALRFIEKYLNQLDANIIYLNCVKPLNKKILQKYYKKKIVIIQDFNIGSITTEVLNTFKNKTVILKEIGLPKKFFLNYGTSLQHYKKLDLDEKKIFKKLLNFFNKKLN